MRASADYAARTRYTGAVADGYVRRRATTAKWTREQQAVEALVRALPAGSRVLDIPAGTGRFFPAYAAAGHRVCGIDISADMLREARASIRRSVRLTLVRGEAERLPLRDGAVDWVVCVRFLNWVPTAQLAPVVHELLRVARTGAILHVRVTRPLTLREVAARIVRRGLWRDPRRLVRRLRRAAGTLAAGARGVRTDYAVHGGDAVRSALAATGAATVAMHTLGCRLRPVHREAHELRLYVVRQAPRGREAGV